MITFSRSQEIPAMKRKRTFSDCTSPFFVHIRTDATVDAGSVGNSNRGNLKCSAAAVAQSVKHLGLRSLKRGATELT